MKIKIYILLLILVILIQSCGIIYHVQTIRDDFEGYTIYRMKGNMLSGSAFLGASIWLHCQKVITDKGDNYYYLIVEYGSDDWLFIEDGESLILLVDGKRIAYNGDGSRKNRDVISAGLVKETAFYEVEIDDIKTIAYAKVVRVKIIGSSYLVERYFSQENILNFRKFYLEYSK
jgi:hypothetical protein